MDINIAGHFAKEKAMATKLFVLEKRCKRKWTVVFESTNLEFIRSFLRKIERAIARRKLELRIKEKES